jgi:excinuclease ABC subunit A
MRATRLRGARTNNLRHLDLDLAPGSLVVVAGPSGAGKSSLAFSTLYAEGQRRYVESFSAYARQFLERLARPPVDELDPVPAAIAVDRQGPVRTSRSTVGTMTEVTDYAKVLWARAAALHCPGCGQLVERDAPSTAAERLLAAAPGARVVVTYPLTVCGTADLLGARERLLAGGYRRLWLGQEVVDLDAVGPDQVFGSGAEGEATLHVVADRAVVRADERSRLAESLEQAMERGQGRADVWEPGGAAHHFSRGLHCARCDRHFREPSPAVFSFNNPIGACEGCRGFGRIMTVDWDKVLPDPSRSLGGGAIRPWQGKKTAWERAQLRRHCALAGVPLDAPVAALTPAQRHWLLEGDELGWPRGWWGLRGWFRWLESKAYKLHVRVLLARYRAYETCPACAGTRLKPEAQSWRLAGLTLPEFYALPAAEALALVRALATTPGRPRDLGVALSECEGRLRALVEVGLGYLSLDRAARSLSGGEVQRVALTGALGAALTGALFVLDEPTVGLHPRDVERLRAAVRRLAAGDNIAVVVEHDRDMIAAADRVIELGPGAGADGGQIVFDGSPAALRDGDTATAAALREGPVAPRPRRPARGWLHLRGARGNNLRGVDLALPLGTLVCVTGVSGSGKSTLVLDTLCPAVRRLLGDGESAAPLPYDELTGAAGLRAVVQVDQAPLGRTSRGNPATYLKAWDVVRKRFAAEPEAVRRELGPGAFSFNVPGGRCEECKGEGAETVEMQFLADVRFSCPSCGGRRFAGPVLEVRHRGLCIADVLELTADQACAQFAADREFLARLAPLVQVGLGYLRLGQPLSTLSGGEAQRLKLAEALARAEAGSLVVLDEPTAGLHPRDVAPLIEVLHALVERGDTVVVVEHDMRLVAQADHVVDLGPEAGAAGGAIVAAGTPEEVARGSGATARHLASVMGASVMGASVMGASVMGASAVGEVVPQPPGGAGPADAAGPAALASGAIDDGTIQVSGAREHNLRNVSVAVPRGRFVVVTGPSGSGKSTLAFDVIYAEGQRRYLETLSPYARQYMPQLPRPAVDRVVGVPPSVSLEQNTARAGANSTVATLTEVAHYLRLIWARIGLLHCPDCGEPIAERSPARMARDLRAALGAGAELTVLAPVVRGRKGLHRELLARAAADGLRQARIDGALVTIEPGLALARHVEHDVDLVIGRHRCGDGALVDSLSAAARLGNGTVRVLDGDGERLLSTRRACPSCGTGFAELDPRLFSFNTRQGACADCEGRGVTLRTVGRGANARELSEPCTGCAGTRLSPLARAVTVAGRSITDLLGRSVSAAARQLARLRLRGRAATIGAAPLAEVGRRLAFLERVGLGYLELDRAAATLSGGEMQRVRLAAQLGSGLTGVLYVLDEPTIGLHPSDTRRLLDTLRALVERGNSVLVVEHDTDTIRAADHVIDVGPGGGRHGGRVVAQGSPLEVARHPDSVTGRTLFRQYAAPRPPRPEAPHWLELRGVRAHNLRDVTVRLPLGRLVAITGVSGSGKSTLVRDVLLRAVRTALGLVSEPPGAYAGLAGHEPLRRAVEIDQSPIGRTPRSVPATYLGVWDHIRKLLAATPLARARGYGASRFSFNVAEGRCPGCDGQGALTVEMSFLPDALLGCELCGGMRFAPETLEVTWRGLNAGQILGLEVEHAAEYFAAVPRVARPLQALCELGLGYLRLGQASSTLSGGEAQRLKLVSELVVASADSTLYVMDEPTTGLHRDDVGKLLAVLHALVERGGTVVVIEHHPDVMAAADWIVDLGPEGGTGGGRIVAQGPPGVVAASGSRTGAVLAELFGTSRVREPVAAPGAAAGDRGDRSRARTGQRRTRRRAS